MACTATVLWCLLVGFAGAETTRFGEVTVGPDYNDSGQVTLLLNGERVEALRKFQTSGVRILRVFDWGTKGDAVLIQTWSGGMHCCDAYHFLRLDTQGVHFSAEFGEHGHDPSDFEVLPDVIRFRLERDFPADIDYQIASYDGVSGTVSDIMEDDTGVVAAGAGADVTRWVGADTDDLLEDPRERVRFRQIMDRDELTQFRTDVYNFGNYEMKDRNLVAWGCRQSMCDVNFGFVGVEVATGQPFAVWFVRGKRRDFLRQGSVLPAPLVALITETLARTSP
jgi:hypothetical protein